MVEIERSYSYCPKCQQGFFLLDLELGLLPNMGYTPLLQEGLIRLGTDLPFRLALRHFQFFTGVKACEASLRRATERAGQVGVGLEEALVTSLEKEPGADPQLKGLEVAYLSGDGCNVPVVGGAWKEVKTLVIGEVKRPVEEAGAVVVHTEELSYFSRCLPIEQFKRASVGEVHRRGVDQARVVCGPCDGADYLQGLLDFHRADTVRILDFPHAAEHLAEAGKAVLGEGSAAFGAWFSQQCHLMKHSNGSEIIAEVEHLRQQALSSNDPAKLKTVEGTLAYFTERREMLRYAHFRELGYPIGSGATESANKVVVEARLKGAGMHWTEEHLNPMLALRNLSCNDRWEKDWPSWEKAWQSQIQQGKTAQATLRRQSRAAGANPGAGVALISVEVPASQTSPLVEGSVPVLAQVQPAQASVAKALGKPGPNHPWRKMKVGRALYAPNPAFVNAKN
jgi:hypothetical protein